LNNIQNRPLISNINPQAYADNLNMPGYNTNRNNYVNRNINNGNKDVFMNQYQQLNTNVPF